MSKDKDTIKAWRNKTIKIKGRAETHSTPKEEWILQNQEYTGAENRLPTPRIVLATWINVCWMNNYILTKVKFSVL